MNKGHLGDSENIGSAIDKKKGLLNVRRHANENVLFE